MLYIHFTVRNAMNLTILFFATWRVSTIDKSDEVTISSQTQFAAGRTLIHYTTTVNPFLSLFAHFYPSIPLDDDGNHSCYLEE